MFQTPKNYKYKYKYEYYKGKKKQKTCLREIKRNEVKKELSLIWQKNTTFKYT